MSEETEDKEEISEGSGYGKRMSDADYAEMKELYELGKSGISELSDAFGYSRQALSRRFKTDGVKRGSRAHEVAATTGAAAKSSPSSSAAAAINRFADKRADWIEETRLEGVNSLKKVRIIASKIVSDAFRATPPTPMAAIDDDLKAVQRFNKILIDNIQNALDILRANEHVDEEDLPSLKIEDLTNEEILQHHKNTGALPEDATIEEMLAEDIEIGEI